jgi:G:T-mismatch repair DNA endonuclease (very short patch repair protein)
MKSIYTEEIKKFLIENYPTHGSIFCANKLGEPFTAKNIQLYCFRHKIRFKKEYEGVNFDINKFIDIKDSSVAYFLGLLWADGYISKNRMSAKMDVARSDGDLFFDMIKEIGHFCKNYKTSPNRKEQVNIALHNTQITNYLCSLGYREKSRISPALVLQKIPDFLKHYFWLGYFDGDGCFYHKSHCCQASYCGSYDQDWSELEKFLKQIGCSYNIQKTISKKGHKSSIVRMTSKFDIVKFGSVLYKNIKTDKIGLPRKYEKFLNIEKQSKKKRNSVSGFTGVRILRNKNGEISYFATIAFQRKYQRSKVKKTAEEAAIEYDKMAVAIYGHRAKTNFPLKNYITTMSETKISKPLFTDNENPQSAGPETPPQDYLC